LKLLKLFPGATPGKDGNGLKFEKTGQFFQILMLRLQKNPEEIYYG